MPAYDTTFDIEINVPYLLMTHLQGRPAHKLWGFADDDDPESRKPSHSDGIIRSNLHSSLACAMAKLKGIEFDAIGLPDYLDDECSGPYIRSEFTCPTLKLKNDQFEDENHIPHQRRDWTEIPKFSSTAQFFDYRIEQATKREKLGEYPDEVGKGVFLHLLHKEIPASRRIFDSTQSETFSLSHNDLDLQNILCDDLGNVTGIVDWEGCTARPHHLGWATTPKRLRSEWEGGYNWPFEKSSLSPYQIQDYRGHYVTALNWEVPEPDKTGGSYPSMSYLTCSLYEACRWANGSLDLWCDHFLQVTLPTLILSYSSRSLVGPDTGSIFLKNLSWASS